MAEQMTVRNVPADDLPEVLDLLLEHLGLRLMCERTPDYTSYELVPAGADVPQPPRWLLVLDFPDEPTGIIWCANPEAILAALSEHVSGEPHDLEGIRDDLIRDGVWHDEGGSVRLFPYGVAIHAPAQQPTPLPDGSFLWDGRTPFIPSAFPVGVAPSDRIAQIKREVAELSAAIQTGDGAKVTELGAAYFGVAGTLNDQGENHG